MTAWEPKPATCGPCGSPSVITYRQKGIYVEQTNACPACGWAYGGLAHVLGNLVRWADGAPVAEAYPEMTIRRHAMRTREPIPLRLLEDNPWQPRRQMDADALQELADSIEQLGLLQAPLARPHPEVSGRYQLAFGHRRVAACRLLFERGGMLPEAPGDLGEPHIEVDVAGISDEDMAILALTENERRQELTQIEVIRAHRKAIDDTALTVQAPHAYPL